MAVNLSPIFNGWQGFTPSGLPLSGGFVQTYLAGTSTPATTYTTSAGNIANSNPIQLASDGRTPSEIWLTAGIAYKFVLTDSLLNSIATYDNIVGIANLPTSIWVASGLTPTFVTPTQFTVTGNQTAIFLSGLRLQYTIASTQSYGSVVSSSFGAGVTTVTITTDSVPLTSGLNAVNISQLTPNDSAVPTTIQQIATFQKGIVTSADNLGRGLAVARSKPATTNRTSSSIADDPDLVIPLSVGLWSFQIWAPMWTSSGAGGLKAQPAFSGAATGAFSLVLVANSVLSTSTATVALGSLAFTANPIFTGTAIAPADYFSITGTINVTNAGNFSLQWGLQVASGSGNIGIGAWMICTRIS